MQHSWCIHTGSTPPKLKPSQANQMAAKGLRYHDRVYRELRKTKLVLHIEPWISCENTGKLCQPDAVALFNQASTAIVIEVKLNWRRRRDSKLKHLYLEAVQQAFRLEHVFPLMIVGNCRGMDRRPYRSALEAMKASLNWHESHPVPILLMPL